MSTAADSVAALAGAILTIDLGAIRENYRQLRSRLGAVRCAAVVKADGYGLGAAEVSQALLEEGCDWFFVAHVGEGIALRRALGGRPTIAVLHGLPAGSETAAIEAGLVPVLNSLGQLAAWRDAARRVGRSLQAVLQVDSGMARLGLPSGDVERLGVDRDAFAGLDVRLVMSHLACADEPAHPANRAQLAEFERLRAMLPAAPASLANSSGVFLGAPWHFDLARPGAALYGINPTPWQENPMRATVRLQVKVIQTRKLPAGAGVGYGLTFTAPEPMRTATIALGYADGWQRGTAASAWCDGVELPFLGRVSMDSIVIDISGLAEGRLTEGDLVDLIGPPQTVDKIAMLGCTIGYEVLTGLGRRFDRRYVGEETARPEGGDDRKDGRVP